MNFTTLTLILISWKTSTGMMCGSSSRKFVTSHLFDDIIARKPEIATSLLDDPDAKLFGQPSLHWAIMHGDADLCRALIAKGAEPEYKYTEESSKTFLHVAAIHSSLDVVKLLLKYVHVNTRNNWGMTPLQYAMFTLGDAVGKRSKKESEEIVEFLVAAGACLDESDGRELTPLYEVIENDNVKLAATMLAAGADANLKTQRKSPLHMAVLRRRYRAMALLIAAGSDIDYAVEEEGALNLAVVDNNEKAVKLFVAAGADVDTMAEYSDGFQTPMILLLQNRGTANRSIFMILVDAGAQLPLECDKSVRKALTLFDERLDDIPRAELSYEDYVERAVKMRSNVITEDVFEELEALRENNVDLMYAILRLTPKSDEAEKYNISNGNRFSNFPPGSYKEKILGENIVTDSEKKNNEERNVFEKKLRFEFYAWNLTEKIYWNFHRKAKLSDTYLNKTPPDILYDILDHFRSVAFDDKILKMSYLYGFSFGKRRK